MSRYPSLSPPWWSRWLLGQSWKIVFDSAHSGLITVSETSNSQLPALTITEVQVSRGILWCSLVVGTRATLIKSGGLTELKARGAADNLQSFINEHIAEIMIRDSGVLEKIDKSLTELVGKGDQYLARADISELAASFGGDTASAISHPLLSKELIPPQVIKLPP